MMRHSIPPSNASSPVSSGRDRTPRWGQKRPTILVVDDDSAVLSVVSRILVRDGMHVLRALGPEQAIEQFDSGKHAIDVVLSDIMMPNMDGMELVAKLRESRPQLSVVYMSALAFKYASTVEDPLLQKPFSNLQLLEAIERLLPSDDS